MNFSMMTILDISDKIVAKIQCITSFKIVGPGNDILLDLAHFHVMVKIPIHSIFLLAKPKMTSKNKLLKKKE